MKERIVLVMGLLLPCIAFASVDSSLMAVQEKLISTVLPLAGMLGLAFAGISFFTGSPNAWNHLKLAIVGAIIGFGGPALIDFVRSLIH